MPQNARELKALLVAIGAMTPRPCEKILSRQHFIPEFGLSAVRYAAKCGYILITNDDKDPEKFLFRATISGRNFADQAKVRSSYQGSKTIADVIAFLLAVTRSSPPPEEKWVEVNPCIRTEAERALFRAVKRGYLELGSSHSTKKRYARLTHKGRRAYLTSTSPAVNVRKHHAVKP